MEEAQVGERQVTSTVWRKLTATGAAVTVVGPAAVGIVLVVLGAETVLALPGRVMVVGLALLGPSLFAARLVHADASGLRVGREVSDRVVPWASVRRVRDNGQGMVQGDTHLELVDGRLVELPGGVRMGSIERWRTETGGALPPPESDDRRTWTLLRPALYWPVIRYVPFVLNVFFDVWGVLLGLVPTAVVAVVLLRRASRPTDSPSRVATTYGHLHVPLLVWTTTPGGA